MAAGLKGLLGGRDSSDSLDALRGLGWRAPWSALAFVVGGVSTAGLPIGVSFAGRWSLYRAIAPSDVARVLLMMLASAGVMAGICRVIATLFWRSRSSGGEASNREGDSPSEGLLTAVLLALAVAACVAVGLFPQLLAPTALRLAGLYTFLAP
jgi:formate hydrogenlyase subunit 3/multisubunit Na+/H+ antiporter MnhD subunit